VAGVPTMWNAMLQAAGAFCPDDFVDLRLAASGGGTLPGEIRQGFLRSFGCTIVDGYGLTESTGAATYSSPEEQQPEGATGRALPGTSIDIRDADGNTVPVGEIGEVYLRGPTIMKGYWKRPEATSAALGNGWLRTGDLGRLDEDGFLYIVDRL